MQATSADPGTLPVDQFPVDAHEPSPAPPVHVSVQLAADAPLGIARTTAHSAKSNRTPPPGRSTALPARSSPSTSLPCSVGACSLSLSRPRHTVTRSRVCGGHIAPCYSERRKTALHSNGAHSTKEAADVNILDMKCSQFAGNKRAQSLLGLPNDFVLSGRCERAKARLVTTAAKGRESRQGGSRAPPSRLTTAVSPLRRGRRARERVQRRFEVVHRLVVQPQHVQRCLLQRGCERIGGGASSGRQPRVSFRACRCDDGRRT